MFALFIGIVLMAVLHSCKQSEYATGKMFVLIQDAEGSATDGEGDIMFESVEGDRSIYEPVAYLRSDELRRQFLFEAFTENDVKLILEYIPAQRRSLRALSGQDITRQRYNNEMNKRRSEMHFTLTVSGSQDAVDSNARGVLGDKSDLTGVANNLDYLLSYRFEELVSLRYDEKLLPLIFYHYHRELKNENESRVDFAFSISELDALNFEQGSNFILELPVTAPPNIIAISPFLPMVEYNLKIS